MLNAFVSRRRSEGTLVFIVTIGVVWVGAWSTLGGGFVGLCILQGWLRTMLVSSLCYPAAANLVTVLQRKVCGCEGGYRCAGSGSGQATTRAQEVVNCGANPKLLLLLIMLLCFQLVGATVATAAAATAGAAAVTTGAAAATAGAAGAAAATAGAAAATAGAGAAAGVVVGVVVAAAAVVVLVVAAALAAADAFGRICICGGVESPRPAVERPWPEIG